MSIADLRRALARSRIPIELLGLTYALSLLVGIGMVQMGNGFALHARDRIVARAHAADPSAIAYARGSRWRAAMLDASRNLGLGAIPETVGGLGIFLPYPAAAYRGWVGGIVSVGSTHVKSSDRAPSGGVLRDYHHPTAHSILTSRRCRRDVGLVLLRVASCREISRALADPARRGGARCRARLCARRPALSDCIFVGVSEPVELSMLRLILRPIIKSSSVARPTWHLVWPCRDA